MTERMDGIRSTEHRLQASYGVHSTEYSALSLWTPSGMHTVGGWPAVTAAPFRPGTRCEDACTKFPSPATPGDLVMPRLGPDFFNRHTEQALNEVLGSNMFEWKLAIREINYRVYEPRVQMPYPTCSLLRASPFIVLRTP